MKIVIDTTMERYMFVVDGDDAMEITQRIMDKYAEDRPFWTLYEPEKNMTTTLRKSEIMAILVYPDGAYDAGRCVNVKTEEV